MAFGSFFEAHQFLHQVKQAAEQRTSGALESGIEGAEGDEVWTNVGTMRAIRIQGHENPVVSNKHAPYKYICIIVTVYSEIYPKIEISEIKSNHQQLSPTNLRHPHIDQLLDPMTSRCCGNAMPPGSFATSKSNRPSRDLIWWSQEWWVPKGRWWATAVESGYFLKHVSMTMWLSWIADFAPRIYRFMIAP